MGKYAKEYAKMLYRYWVKYSSILMNPSELFDIPISIRGNVLKAMVCRSKYLGCYKEFTDSIKNHGIKWTQEDSLTSFNRIFNNNNHNGLSEWYTKALSILADHEKLYLRFMLLSGVRKEEGLKSFNMLVSLQSKFTEYYNMDTGFLEHYKYPKLFLRNTKNVYVTAIPIEIVKDIANSKTVSVSTIRKKLNKHGLGLRIKELRSFYATTMRNLGLLSEQIDLVQGRIGKSIFLQHYFKQNPKPLSHKIIRLLPRVENALIIP